MGKSAGPEDEIDEREVARRRDEVLRRMAATRPIPHGQQPGRAEREPQGSRRGSNEKMKDSD